MDPIQSGSNPINNPRLDLLHNTGSNQHLKGAAGSYGPDATAFHSQGASPTPPAGPSKEAASYVAAAQSKKPETPVPMPAPQPPVPRPAPTPTNVNEPSSSITPSGGGGRKWLIILLILLVLIAIAGGGYWWWTHRSKPAATTPPAVTVTPVTPTNLQQLDGNGGNLDAGATTPSAKVHFQFNVHTSANSGSLTPEVEIEPAGTDFTGQPTATGQAVSASGNMQLSIASDALKNGAYHWQVRDSIDGKHSAWVIYGGDAKATAFTVNATTPVAPTVSTIGGVNVANPTVVTSNRPPLVGKADAGATITVSISPDSQKFTTTADSSGAWTVTPSTDIPNGQHQLSITATNAAGVVSSATQIALTVNPATAADTTPSPAASPTPAPAPAASSSTAAATPSPAPAPSSNLAATGDNTITTSLASLAVMVMAAAGIVWMRRRYAAR